LGITNRFTSLAGSKKKVVLKKRPYIFLISFIIGILLSTGVSWGQLQTAGGISAFNLVQNTLLGGGVQLISVNFQGSTGAIGTFNGNSSNIGISSGVIMTTGVISGPDGPIGPNTVPNAGVDNGTGGYGLLDNIVSPTFNATVIEFTFIPQGDSINFKYVFASEEYKEYVGSDFNDVFGFFLSGPKPGGGNYSNQNIALVPGSSTPVAINNVNHLTNSGYYVDNESPSPGTSVQYDGFTKPLIAKASVKPCSTYTIRLAIADVGDGIYDSGVFLEAHSFSSNGMDVSSEITGSFNADTLYETCGEADVTFTITGNTSIANTIHYQILGSATQGVDYTITPPGTIVHIPAGQSSSGIVIHPIIDGVNEGLEYIIIELIDTAACPNVQMPRDTIYLQNVSPISVTARQDTSLVCNNEVLYAYALATGGAGNITLAWSDGLGQGNFIPFIARNTETYVVTATDQCGSSMADSFTVFVPNVAPLVLTFTSDTAICPGTPVTLNAGVGGGIGPLNLSWSTGETNIYSKLVGPLETIFYSVILTDSCGNSLTDGALVTVLAPTVDISYSYKDNRIIQFFSTASSDVVTYAWEFGDGQTSALQNPEHTYADSGYYQVMLVVTNEFGCTDTAFELIYAYPDFRFFIPNTFTPNMDALNDVFTGLGIGFVKYEMRIFNRWGQEIFYTNDINRGWAGTDNYDNNCPIGVYAYKVELETPAQFKYKYIGHVNLLR
jgi:gliding motility-associated-like protein